MISHSVLRGIFPVQRMFAQPSGCPVCDGLLVITYYRSSARMNFAYYGGEVFHYLRTQDVDIHQCGRCDWKHTQVIC